MEKLTSERAFEEAAAGHKPTVFVFKAGWCKDCHYIEPFMPEVEAAYADKLSFVEVDVDQFPDLSSKLHILGIPSFVVYKGGKELTRFVSKLRKTREEIEHFLDRSVQVADALSQ